MKKFIRPAIFALSLASIVSIAGIFGLGLRSSAGTPEYWITVDEKELQHVRSAAEAAGSGLSFDVAETRGGIAIVKLDELQLLELSRGMHNEFHKCAGFMRHESYEIASRSIDESLAASTELQLVEYSINNQAAVNPMLAEAQEPTVRQTILDLSSLYNRRHNLQGGIDGANMIYSKWRQLALGRSDISVVPYTHRSASDPETYLTPQPSIIMTIQGTTHPDEIVVLGGHQDSINGTTGQAPGADDDASGIASLTEVIRVLVETGFRPERTVQFMAYAAEEVGLVGSANIATNYRNENKNVIGVLQLDMTNYKGTSADIAIMTDFTNGPQNQFIRDLITEYQPSLVVINDVCGYGCSDHKSWTDKSYPSSMPFEAKFSTPREYNTALHTVNDTISRSNNNANHALKFAKLGISFVGELAKGSIQQTAPARTPFDFDGDGKSDPAVFRASDGVWHLNRSTDGYTAAAFGIATDGIVPADYDGDGKADIAVYRDGIWHLMRTQLGYTSMQFGETADIPQPADYDGDGKDDIAVFRPSTARWYILRSTSGWLEYGFGLPGDKPLTGDFDGDGKSDPAVYRDGTWHILGSTAGYSAVQFGIATDEPLVADFDGDGKADPSVYRDGIWYNLRSTGGFSAYQWGMQGDVPVAADFDGDGKADAAVYRGGVWYVLKSSDSQFRIEAFGLADDQPAQSAYAR